MEKEKSQGSIGSEEDLASGLARDLLNIYMKKREDKKRSDTNVRVFYFLDFIRRCFCIDIRPDGSLSKQISLYLFTRWVTCVFSQATSLSLWIDAAT